MDTSTIVWIIVAVVVVAAVIAFVVSRSGALRVQAQREQAADIREKAVGHDRRLRENEASATEADARAQMARAEAQKRELEAERLAAEAESRSDSADAVRRERDEQLRLADLCDPDVETDRDGNRLDRGADTLQRRDTVDDGSGDRVDEANHAHDERRDTLSDGSGDRVDERAQGYDQRRTDAP